MSTLLSLMLVGLSLGQTPQTVQPFPDVPKTHWAYAAVTELHEKGILKGCRNKSFKYRTASEDRGGA